VILDRSTPNARGLAPLLVTLGATAFAGEMLGFVQLLGVLFLGVGVMLLAFDKTPESSVNPTLSFLL